MADMHQFWVLPSIELELCPTNEFPDLGVINSISTPLKTLIDALYIAGTPGELS